MSLADKVIVVTGAARGIGREYVLAFAAQGAKILAGDISNCDETVELALKTGGSVIGARLDVTDRESAKAAVDAAVSAYGKIDGLVNNAALYGTLRGGRFDALEEKDWDAAMTVNVKGVWNCCKAVVPHMKDGGSIVNVASLAASYGMPYALHYVTSKAAVQGMTRSLARELGRMRIRVNAISPSAVQTEGTDQFFGEKKDVALEVIRKNQAIAETLQPKDLVGTVAWLLSDQSAFITGQNIMVDGGTIMN